MAFVPPVPGFAPVSYGQGFGNWQQYAGYSKSSPFGASQELLPARKPPTAAVPAPVVDATPTPVAPQITAAVPPGAMGANPATSMGALPTSPLGTVDEDAVKKAVNSHFGE